MVGMHVCEPVVFSMNELYFYPLSLFYLSTTLPLSTAAVCIFLFR